MKNFIHLHLHSEYSLLDSSLKLENLIQKALNFNMPAIALTDHGNILGAVHFYKMAKKKDIKPIIGSELYIAPESRLKKGKNGPGDPNYHHLIVLVKNDRGYRNLSELISCSFLEGFYRKPRIDKETLQKYREGLIVLSACIQGEIPYYLLRDRQDRAYESARWFRDTFGDDFYLEVQNHSLDEQLEVIPKLEEMSRELSIPMVATNDVHYLNMEDAKSREILICLQTNEVLSNPDRAMKLDTEQMYFKSCDEMLKSFPGNPEWIDLSMEIAAKCNFDFKLGQYFLPEFSVPADTTIDDYFEKVCLQGFEALKPKLQNKKNTIDVYQKRLTYEIAKIREMGFPGYFLIVWDIIKYARDQGIPVGPGRGSVVGSLVAYMMGITSVDPLDYDLIFERFLNPERISMPDIDIDFDGERRDEIIEYIKNKYGEESVAQIVTLGRMKAKLAIRDIGRVLEIPLSNVNKLAKMIPEGPKVKLKEEIDTNPDLQKEIKHLPETKKLMEYGLILENNIRHPGKHAAGVVIAPKRLTEFMPLFKVRDDIVTQFEKDEVEEIGLLKMDILGLKTLTIIKNILREIEEVEGISLDLDAISLEDKKTFEIFQRGDTDGIFQFESSGMREYLKRSKPDKFEDLIVLNALYRPGPLGSGMADSYVNRKLGKEKVTFILPDLEEILKDTYGIIVFQEQVMQISVKIAGFTMSKADEMRKIMGKKLTHKIPAIEKEFIDGAHRKKYPKKASEELFSQMKTFAEYGFNKSHSTAYGALAYQTAYLKAHFPIYFMAANLSSEAGKTATSSKMIQYISESKKMGFSILPPDINKSVEQFRVETLSAIRYGLKGLKNVGESAIRSILEARDSGEEFKSLSDFITRIDLNKVNKSVLESLIKSGALDSFGDKRSCLYEGVGSILKQAAILEKSRNQNQRALFTEEEAGPQIRIPRDLCDLDEWSENEIIQYEKEITGIYITYNPIEKFRNEISVVSNTSILQILGGEFRGDMVKLGGVISEYTQRKSKKGDFYGEFFFEDLTGRIKVLAFKDRWEKLKNSIRLDFPYFLEGRLPDNSDKDSNIYLENLTELEVFLKKKARKVLIKIDYSLLNESFNKKLTEKLKKNHDSVPYILMVLLPDGFRTIIGSSETGDGLKPTISMKRDIETLTGENTIEILY